MQGVPSDRNYTGGFACDLMVKDLSLANASAGAAKTAMPMGALAQQLYALMSARGDGGKLSPSVLEGIYTSATEDLLPAEMERTALLAESLEG